MHSSAVCLPSVAERDNHYCDNKQPRQLTTVIPPNNPTRLPITWPSLDTWSGQNTAEVAVLLIMAPQAALAWAEDAASRSAGRGSSTTCSCTQHAPHQQHPSCANMQRADSSAQLGGGCTHQRCTGVEPHVRRPFDELRVHKPGVLQSVWLHGGRCWEGQQGCGRRVANRAPRVWHSTRHWAGYGMLWITEGAHGTIIFFHLAQPSSLGWVPAGWRHKTSAGGCLRRGRRRG